ncbi:MAG: ATP synthase F1 subunit epsilon [Lachnospiraceae bacterium]|nr:ATP synthase F1 subunit epsilon [Lachnospiraceae bacterium]MCI9368976.1 ATP synthase F1 subunit epsilon [Lachnospiraceae bacterium]MDE7308114.1 ATP synthase F1 subunit epsilon [Lachnospiraceae bacterium]
MNTFKLKIMTSNKVFYDGECLKLIITATDGALEIMANHEAAVFAVVPGVFRYTLDDSEWIEAVSGNGFVMVYNNEAMLIIDSAELPEDIDMVRAEEAKERAEEQMRQDRSQREYLHSKASLARAMARLKATSKYNKYNQ